MDPDFPGKAPGWALAAGACQEGNAIQMVPSRHHRVQAFVPEDLMLVWDARDGEPIAPPVWDNVGVADGGDIRGMPGRWPVFVNGGYDHWMDLSGLVLGNGVRL